MEIEGLNERLLDAVVEYRKAQREFCIWKEKRLQSEIDRLIILIKEQQCQKKEKK